MALRNQDKAWHRCLVCAKAFEREASWLQHMERHENQRQQRRKRLRDEALDRELSAKLPRTTN
ncbi:hypothetical protein ACHHYP_12636 [Achlya hypogyna]|uniref:C2H2-type domain-containing protein n=1 Tax=Achlya hypogyna TaxID=1202772 RepID=A0A1V9YGJ2_ACHHY|nr:hypothetical protein ACHHYP_12636 [Achlya hypogyna]